MLIPSVNIMATPVKASLSRRVNANSQRYRRGSLVTFKLIRVNANSQHQHRLPDDDCKLIQEG